MGKITKTDQVAVISELRQKYKLTALLELAEMSRSNYYYHVKKESKPDKYRAMKEMIMAIYHENQGRYGKLFWITQVGAVISQRIQFYGGILH